MRRAKLQTLFVTARRDLATPGNLGRRVDLPHASPPLLDLVAVLCGSAGRFCSRDPIGYFAGDPNQYRYVHNRPISARRNAYPCGGIEKLMDGAGEQRLQWNRPTAATMERLLMTAMCED